MQSHNYLQTKYKFYITVCPKRFFPQPFEKVKSFWIVGCTNQAVGPAPPRWQDRFAGGHEAKRRWSC